MSKGAKTALIIGSVVVGVIVVFSVIPAIFRWRSYGMGGMMGWPGWWGGLGFMFLGPVLGLAFIGLIVWAIVAALGGARQALSSDSALEILRQRYAKGEITKEEYEAKKKDLMGN